MSASAETWTCLKSVDSVPKVFVAESQFAVRHRIYKIRRLQP